ncbi:helix-turn-helix domain-containing protein [Paenibacillus puldeungensis]|uniref:Helix-turn-helix domain-containing protein n=1 Tax=Paenibacillus puldeungensis TaxID=696536 RepID=A0ABW3RVU8_9BACL
MILKALLVDDEIHILNNLAKVLPWGELGFMISGLAKNGKEALELAAMHHPDLILSDIRMPVMDGIALLQKVRELNFPCEFLLLTGYQEFEYARTAIRYGVKDYICKPINYVELENTVREMARQIGEKRRTESKTRCLSQAVHLANENVLLHTLLGQETERESLLWAEEEGMGEERRYSVMLLDLDGYSYRSITWNSHERKAWNLHIKRTLKDVFGDMMEGLTVLQIREGEWCIIFSAPPTDQPITKERLFPKYVRLRQMLLREGDGVSEQVALRICLDQQPHVLHELAAAYHHQQQMLILDRSEEWFLNAETKPAGDFGPDMYAADAQWRWMEQLGSALRGGNQESFDQTIGELKSYFGHLDESQVGGAEKLLHYLLIHMLREMRELQMLSVEREKAIWQRLQGSLSMKELLSLIVSLMGQSRSGFSSKKSSELLMISAGDYIRNHLGNDFGIEDIADYLGISSSYFCLLFKNHFGETFVEYLTRQRMEMAKCLLRSSERSITQIGAEIGYQERRYFTKVFQKYTGMTPSDFRQRESHVS